VQLLLAEEWRCRYLYNNHRYPIEEARDRREITKAKARLYLSMIVETDRRWKLVKTAEPLLREEFNLLNTSINSPDFQYPFNSDFDFFTHVLREEADQAFSCCLEPYLEISSKRYSEIFDDILEFNSLEERSPQLCFDYLKKIENNFKGERPTWNWWTLMLFICEIHAPQNREIMQKLIDYKQSCEKTLRAAKTVTRKMPSKAWKKGGLLLGSQKGGVYR
jgi:hypothetical protein